MTQGQGRAIALPVIALSIAGCNLVCGAGEDVRSIGRVLSDDPDESGR